MFINRRNALVMLASATTTGISHAQAKSIVWPTKTVKFVVGAAAGGSASDAVTRFIGQHISERYKQPVVVENRPGADGNLAAESVARAAPDGSVFLVTGNNTHAANDPLYKFLPWNPEKDFAAVTTLARVPYVSLIDKERGRFRSLILARLFPGVVLSYWSGARYRPVFHAAAHRGAPDGQRADIHRTQSQRYAGQRVAHRLCNSSSRRIAQRALVERVAAAQAIFFHSPYHQKAIDDFANGRPFAFDWEQTTDV